MQARNVRLAQAGKLVLVEGSAHGADHGQIAGDFAAGAYYCSSRLTGACCLYDVALADRVRHAPRRRGGTRRWYRGWRYALPEVHYTRNVRGGRAAVHVEQDCQQ